MGLDMYLSTVSAPDVQWHQDHQDARKHIRTHLAAERAEAALSLRGTRRSEEIAEQFDFLHFTNDTESGFYGRLTEFLDCEDAAAARAYIKSVPAGILEAYRADALSEPVELGYWRKANHIHAWFVDHVQGGVDDCEEYVVRKEQLAELRDACETVLRNWSDKTSEELLPTQGGFFFGGTDYDEYYYEDVKHTLTMLDTALTLVDFDNQMVIYSSSW